jgi:ubiquitin-conjugating enzyme E2 D/E
MAMAPISNRIAAGGGGIGLKRVMREYLDVSNNPIAGCSVFVGADDARCWKVVMTDLPEPYVGGSWLLTVNFPSSYPFSPPNIRFVTPVYHCNISMDGLICLDVLKSSWSPAQSISKALTAIRCLLVNPNADDPLDSYKGQLFRDNRVAFFTEATRHTMTVARDDIGSLTAKYNLA